MFKKKQAKRDQLVKERDTIFASGTPGGGGRQVIGTFIEKGKSADFRRLDNFQRPEGYQPFMPRSVGAPILGGNGSDDLENSSQADGNSQEASRHRSIFRWQKKKN